MISYWDNESLPFVKDLRTYIEHTMHRSVEDAIRVRRDELETGKNNIGIELHFKDQTRLQVLWHNDALYVKVS